MTQSDSKTTRRDEPDDEIFDGASVQTFAICLELALEPSYKVTLS